MRRRARRCRAAAILAPEAVRRVLEQNHPAVSSQGGELFDQHRMAAVGHVHDRPGALRDRGRGLIGREPGTVQCETSAKTGVAPV